MPRSVGFAVVAVAAFLFLAGCAYIPVLSEIGLLPGPPTSLVVKVVPQEELAAVLSEYGDIGTQPCPVGEIWVGTINVGANTLSINSCIDMDLAIQYAESFGVL